ARVWGRRPLVDGRSFRELVEWKGTSLWWMTETFFRTSTEAVACVGHAETFLRILEAESPQEVEAVGLDARDVVLLERAATARGVLCHSHARPKAARAGSWTSWLRDSLPRGAPRPPLEGHAPFVLVTDAAPPPPDESTAVVSLGALRDGDTAAARQEKKRARRRFEEALAQL